jgi:hypothetical protein
MEKVHETSLYIAARPSPCFLPDSRDTYAHSRVALVLLLFDLERRDGKFVVLDSCARTSYVRNGWLLLHGPVFHRTESRARS